MIFFLTFLLVKFYSQKVSPKVIEVAEVRIKRFTESFLSNNIGYDILNDEVIDDILVINKNSDGEILYVDYNLDKAYKTLDVVTSKLNSLLIDLENGYVEDNTDNSITPSKYGLILELPMFISSDSVLLANLGPKVYFKVHFVGSLLTNIRSQITDYGLNNALVELYVTIKITEDAGSDEAPSVVETLNTVTIHLPDYRLESEAKAADITSGTLTKISDDVHEDVVVGSNKVEVKLHNYTLQSTHDSLASDVNSLEDLTAGNWEYDWSGDSSLQITHTIKEYVDGRTGRIDESKITDFMKSDLDSVK